MPKINIREIDDTGSELDYSYLENLTLVPGVRLRKMTTSSSDSTVTVLSTVEGIYTNAKTFLNAVEEAVKTENAYAGKTDPEGDIVKAIDLTKKKDYGFIYTCYLLSQGIPVYYLPAYTENDLLNASDTMSIIPSQFKTVEDEEDGEIVYKEILSTQETSLPIVKSAHYMFDFDTFTDRGLYDIRFITLAGLSKDEFISKALLAAATRSDAVLLTSVPEKGEQGLKVSYDITIDGETETRTVYLPKTDYSASETYEIDINGNFVEGSTTGNVKAYKLNTAEKIDSWVQSKLASAARNYVTHTGYTWSAVEGKEQIGKYAAIFAPTCVTDLTIVGTAKNYDYKDLKIPADFVYLTTYGNMITNKDPWKAVAGPQAGISPLSPTPSVKFGDADVALFEPREEVESVVENRTSTKVQLKVCTKEAYVDDEGVSHNAEYATVTGYVLETNSVKNHVAINPICNIDPFGNIIWGNRTMYALQAPENGSSTKPQLVASSFLNIRNLIISLKKRLYRSSRQFTFASNSDSLWINFKATVTPLLEKMLHNEGIRGYTITKINTTKKALLAAEIKIIPIEAVEDFDLTVTLTDSINVEE